MGICLRLRLRAWTLLCFAVACGGNGGTGPGESVAVGPIGPFPPGVAGKVVFMAGGAVHLIDVANPGDRVIYTAQQSSQCGIDGFTWPPDGQHLVIGCGIMGDRTLRLLSITGTQDGLSDRSIFDGPGPEFSPAYSADGRLAYFAGIYGDPTAGIFIDGQSVYPTQHFNTGSHISWNAAGDALAIACQACPGPAGLLRLSLSDGTLTPLLVAENGELILHPAYSPDGSRIAISRVKANRLEIWTVAANGGDPQQLTTGFAADFPAWTPGGSYIAFSHGGPPASAPGIYVVAPGGGAPIRVVGVGTPGPGPIAWSR
jgi:hypothetical protein